MTSGVYPRQPGNKSGRKPMFSKVKVEHIRFLRLKGRTTKFLAAYFKASEKTIRHVLNGAGAYKDMK